MVPKTLVIVIMGVAGSGKTRIGRLLADRLTMQFIDADDYHPQKNVEKMSAGLALSDEDRVPWLEALRALMSLKQASNEPTVLACSALKASYRDLLAINNEVVFVYLRGDFKLISQRLSDRVGHFMKTKMLESQFETLEEPHDAIVVDTNSTPQDIVDNIINRLGQRPSID